MRALDVYVAAVSVALFEAMTAISECHTPMMFLTLWHYGNTTGIRNAGRSVIPDC